MSWKNLSRWKKGGIIGLVVGLLLSALSFALIWIAPNFAQPGGFGDIVAVLLPILPGLLTANFFLRLFGGEITSLFYVVGHFLNILIFTLAGILIGLLFGKKKK